MGTLAWAVGALWAVAVAVLTRVPIVVAVLRLSTRWGRLGRGVLGLGLGLWCRLCLWLCAIGLSRRWLVLGPGLCKGGWLVPHTAALWSRGCRCSLCWCSLCSCRGCCGWRWRRCCCWCSWRCVTFWSLFGSGLFGPCSAGELETCWRTSWSNSETLHLRLFMSVTAGVHNRSLGLHKLGHPLNIPSWLGSCKESGRICWKDSTWHFKQLTSLRVDPSWSVLSPARRLQVTSSNFKARKSESDLPYSLHWFHSPCSASEAPRAS